MKTDYKINEAIKLKLIGRLEISYLTSEEQHTLISLRRDTKYNLEGALYEN